jgi:hypothetical protein
LDRAAATRRGQFTVGRDAGLAMGVRRSVVKGLRLRQPMRMDSSTSSPNGVDM